MSGFATSAILERRRATGSQATLLLAMALAAASLVATSACAAGSPEGAPAAAGTPAKSQVFGEFHQQEASEETRHVVRWIGERHDNHRMPFVVIDKVDAKVFVFDGSGQLLGAAPALLGMARGDQSAAGIGARKLSAIGPTDRTTPAGRFMASLDRDVHGSEILLIDYDNSIALHAVVKGTVAERRAERLNSATTADNRISFGCINVPAKFYAQVVSSTFHKKSGVVYILPEMSKAKDWFEGYGGHPGRARTRLD